MNSSYVNPYTFLSGSLTLNTAACLIAGYVAYYGIFVVKKPVIAGSLHMKQFLTKYCPIVCDYYWPAAWCLEPISQTIISSLIGSSLQVPYERDTLNLADGGVVALDWVPNDTSHIPSEQRPTVIILPGLVGSSRESYARELAHQSTLLGYRSVVFNNRGKGGMKLQTPRFYCAAYVEDLSAVVQHVKKRYSSSPVFAIGISFGGILLTNYLAKTGKNSGLTAAMTVSSAWNMFESSVSLERPLISFIFNKRLTQQLKDSVKEYEHFFRDKCDLNRVYSSQTIRDFDEAFTAPMFGFDSHASMYAYVCTDRKIAQIEIPLLSLNAADDPFAPEHSIPLEEANKSSNVAIVVTPRGGHIAFMDGLFGLKRTRYIQRTFSQFFGAIFQHSDELNLLNSQ